MISRLAAALAALTLLATATPAHAGRAVGVGLGTSTLGSGVSVKWKAKSGSGMQLVAGPAGDDLRFVGDTIAVNLDGLRNMGRIGTLGPIGVDWSIGGGGGVAVGGGLTAAAAGVVGLNLALQNIPLEFSLEYRPVAVVVPVVAFDVVNASGHLRWWF